MAQAQVVLDIGALTSYSRTYSSKETWSGRLLKRLPLLPWALLIAASCTPELRIPAKAQASPPLPSETALHCPLSSPDLCKDYCTDLRWDMENCGKCGVLCSSTNHCYYGVCKCGPYDTCDLPSVCARDICIAPDLEGLACEDDGYCRPPTFCVSGHCTLPKCTQEVCDGYDNDCNGLIDDPPLALARICYEGPIGTANVGTCIYGLSICFGGRYGPCEGQSLPSEERGILRCDGLDNDCDSCPDNYYGIDGECTSSPLVLYDTVFYIDYSGSMTGYIAAVVEATDLLASPFLGNDSYHWALVGIPSNSADSITTVISDLAEYSAFSAALVIEGTVTGGGACEDNMGGPYQGITGTLPLSYRTEAIRIHIVFSDEFPQTCSLGTIGEPELCAEVDLRGDLLAVFNSATLLGSWDDCALTYPLTTSGDVMAEALEEVLGEACEL